MSKDTVITEAADVQANQQAMADTARASPVWKGQARRHAGRTCRRLRGSPPAFKRLYWCSAVASKTLAAPYKTLCQTMPADHSTDIDKPVGRPAPLLLSAQEQSRLDELKSALRNNWVKVLDAVLRPSFLPSQDREVMKKPCQKKPWVVGERSNVVRADEDLPWPRAQGPRSFHAERRRRLQSRWHLHLRSS
jgi:hypothetical protein